MENPSKMDDLGVPPIFGNTQVQTVLRYVKVFEPPKTSPRHFVKVPSKWRNPKTPLEAVWIRLIQGVDIVKLQDGAPETYYFRGLIPSKKSSIYNHGIFHRVKPGVMSLPL